MRWLTLAVAAALAGCASLEEPSWHPPADYEYTLTSRCGESWHYDNVRIAVNGGVATFVRADGEAPKGKIPTLEDLLGEYRDAVGQRAYKTEVKFDPADGHVTEIGIDPDRNTVDDEVCYFITDYRPGAGTAPSKK